MKIRKTKTTNATKREHRIGNLSLEVLIAFKKFFDLLSKYDLQSKSCFLTVPINSDFLFEYKDFIKNHNFQLLKDISDELTTFYRIVETEKKMDIEFAGTKINPKIFSTVESPKSLAKVFYNSLHRLFSAPLIHPKYNSSPSESLKDLRTLHIAIWLCRMLYNVDAIRVWEKNLAFDYKQQSNIIDSEAEDAIDSIFNKFKNNQEVVLSSINPLIDDLDFLKLVIDNKIPFSSKSEPEISEKFSNILLKVSELKGFGKAGNPNAGINTIGPANDFAKEIGPVLDKLEKQGFKTYQAKADELNEKGIKTLRGKEWERATVRLTMQRWLKLKEDHEKKPSSKTPKPE